MYASTTHEQATHRTDPLTPRPRATPIANSTRPPQKQFPSSLGSEAVPAAKFSGDSKLAVWLPNEQVAKKWMQYVKDTAVVDATPPPAPRNLRIEGNVLTWEAEADLESGTAQFLIERDGEVFGAVPEDAKNPFGRPLFQGLQYSDTPVQPLARMTFTDAKAVPGKKHR